MIRRPRRAATTVFASLAVLATLTACSSSPGNRRVLEDQIEAFVVTGEITEEQGECMQRKLLEYDDDELQAIADENEEEGAEQSESLGLFTENFEQCMLPGGAAPPASSEPSTGSTEPGDAPATTEASDTTEVTETTEAPETTGG